MMKLITKGNFKKQPNGTEKSELVFNLNLKILIIKCVFYYLDFLS